MKLLICTFFTSLFMDISLNYFFICKLTNRIYLVSITPKLTSPKLGLHLWMKSKQFFCRNTFYRLYNILSRHHWHTLYHKMNTILVPISIKCISNRCSIFRHTSTRLCSTASDKTFLLYFIGQTK